MERVAVVGLGNIATRHRRNLKQLFPNALLYAMSASGRVPQETVNDADLLVTSIEELIEQRVQLVIIASPAPFHAAHAIPLIEVGIAVLIEKPVTASQADEQRLRKVALQHDTPVAVGYCLRYLSSALEMKALLAAGKIGQLYHAHVEIGQYLPDWRPSKDYRDSVSAKASLGGGALLELSHEFDYTQWLLGDLTLEHAILRQTKELGLDVEDSADMLLSTSKQAIVHMHLDFLQRKAHRQCRFVGSKGALEWDLIGNEIRFVTPQGTQVLYSEPKWDKNQMYTAMLADFVAQIHQQPNQCVSLAEAAQSVELIEEIKQRFPITPVPGELKGE
ncbi:Gfo/Idh/MocA family oxidoreductase [Vibrio vulnificus]|uniref:Gfo/Idh/MocA family protein n=1 Tax=Vibrio vulnificus TaxID=672 RepID=UPI0005F265B4|nr:Gfo/Idh/MocA family oxidoreductase [Vibrio vulnificus]EHH2450031.1 Gfo/Idh/MocA family oxidoreductase [Vibrio vulnificus]EIZ4668275.1 Gfo/Idh/MocA family oxidoreductase [Vibrio vulnificus]MCA3962252.1 Gfo/Idh/MocA family oxidoreductase [Vibrio vulnificus]HDY7691956.1 Gfo/Idh/MocA family oxidoreductase [Vibrio vulnificus]HDY7807293.1 Gfo/Idh/MocA family oxidoreductase [Vibrio vulnificus]